MEIVPKKSSQTLFLGGSYLFAICMRGNGESHHFMLLQIFVFSETYLFHGGVVGSWEAIHFRNVSPLLRVAHFRNLRAPVATQLSHTFAHPSDLADTMKFLAYLSREC